LPFDVAYIKTLKNADLNFEFYFRCIENILTTIEDVNSEKDKEKLLILISNLLTNDEKFFLKYFELFSDFKGFKKLIRYKNDLIKDLYIDYRN
jgi:hypothetical protein